MNKDVTFPVERQAIEARIDAIDPVAYARTRNFLDGHVTWMSPYITHGVVTTEALAQKALVKQSLEAAEKYIFELAWREFFHHVWLAKGEEIFEDLEQAQAKSSPMLSDAVLQGQTNIEVIDQCLQTLTKTGGMHNHARMWTASMVCNMARSGWQSGSRWMYYHLMDGDLASNTLSWQWVAATFSSKPYLFNQDNVDKYSRQSQTESWLNMPYEALPSMDVPDVLMSKSPWVPDPVQWPAYESSEHAITQDVCLHHLWNLDPDWRSQQPDAQHVLLIEPAIMDAYPMSQKRVDWLWALAQSMMPNVPLYVESFATFQARCKGRIFYKEYPLANHWQGEQDARDWMFDLTQKEFRRFFAFWKYHKKRTF